VPEKDDFDDAAGEDASKDDYFVLADDQGNVTVGYMLRQGVGSLLSYNGVDAPILPEHDETVYPYATVVWHELSSVQYLTLYLTAERPYADTDSMAFSGALRLPIASSVKTYVCEYADGDAANSTWVFESEETLERLLSFYPVRWTNYDLLNRLGHTVLKASEPDPAGFGITSYNTETTEFKAIGWRRVSWHTTGENAGTITVKDWTDAASEGWNYFKHLRACTRKRLCFYAYEVFPNKFLWVSDIKAEHPYSDAFPSGQGFYLPPIAPGDKLRVTVDGETRVLTVCISERTGGGTSVFFGNSQVMDEYHDSLNEEPLGGYYLTPNYVEDYDYFFYCTHGELIWAGMINGYDIVNFITRKNEERNYHVTIERL